MQFSIFRSLAISGLLTIAIACWLGGGLGNSVDVALIRQGISARAAGPLATDAGLFLNYAGGAPATLGLGLATAMLLYFREHKRAALWFVAIAGVGRLLVEGIKLTVQRARPALDPHPVLTHSLSFPSAHAANSMIVFPMLVLFLVAPGKRLLPMAIAIFASLIIGASRPLLGVHWPSDVVAGWALGGAWLLTTWPIARASVSREHHHDIVSGHRAALLEE
ncbi:MAG: phosphatase PAP2 family protein [Pseudomonadota bacterium]|nr:phosphatase PAP2 family protein [Pseudomonadota bacterium]